MTNNYISTVCLNLAIYWNSLLTTKKEMFSSSKFAQFGTLQLTDDLMTHMSTFNIILIIKRCLFLLTNVASCDSQKVFKLASPGYGFFYRNMAIDCIAGLYDMFV